ncbi:MAG: 3-phosphoserine/phosphohydroxythreonine transaminase [Gammaproteobacteria bacterium]
MARVFNFSAGPSTLPEAVLEQARDEMLDWQGSGMSVMEMSHRGRHFSVIAEQLEADLRELMAIPDNYKVLFLQGGATAQFSMIPMNILNGKSTACYVNTGAWSAKAIADAARFCQVKLAADAEASGFTAIPDVSEWSFDPDAAYLHYTANETIHGVEFQSVPEAGELPLVCDMSSNILSRPVDVGRFGLIYAGTQKNMGPSGVTLVIVREDLIGRNVDSKLPDVFNYEVQAKNGSMLNTPATYNWYLVGLVLKWLKAAGGIEAVESQNVKKASLLYQTIDQSRLYRNPVQPAYRSRMNVPFILSDAVLDKVFLAEAEAQGLLELKGHRSVGGMRASIYNAMPEHGVRALCEFMTDFEKRH